MRGPDSTPCPFPHATMSTAAASESSCAEQKAVPESFPAPGCASSIAHGSISARSGIERQSTTVAMPCIEVRPNSTADTVVDCGDGTTDDDADARFWFESSDDDSDGDDSDGADSDERFWHQLTRMRIGHEALSLRRPATAEAAVQTYSEAPTEA